jgi:pimeloyl-ACP methyl ester carboxylesterase
MRDAYARSAPDPDHFDLIAERTSAMVHGFDGWSDDEIRSIDAPTLLIFGDTDFIPLARAVEMFELFPNAQLAVLPGTTHVGVTRRPAPVLSLIGPFLDPTGRGDPGPVRGPPAGRRSGWVGGPGREEGRAPGDLLA